MEEKKKTILGVITKERLKALLPKFPSANILVIGDFILDQYIWGNVDRISPEAPVPVVHVMRESYMPGGCLNVANNIHALGGKVFPCGVVGRDLMGRMLLKVMRREGIETGGVVYEKTRPTTLKTRVIAHSQHVVRFDREDVEEVSGPSLKKIFRFVKEKIPRVHVVILEDYGKGVIQRAFVRKVLALAKRYRVPVLVDPKEKNFPYYKGATLVSPNRKEAYAGIARNGYLDKHKDNLEYVGKSLLKKLNLQAVLITLGEEGMALFERKGKWLHIPTTARQVYDVSGAGDTVIAVFALAIACGATMREAAVLSNLAAGVVVGKLGTATVDAKELEQAIEDWKP